MLTIDTVPANGGLYVVDEPRETHRRNRPTAVPDIEPCHDAGPVSAVRDVRAVPLARVADGANLRRILSTAGAHRPPVATFDASI